MYIGKVLPHKRWATLPEKDLPSSECSAGLAAKNIRCSVGIPDQHRGPGGGKNPVRPQVARKKKKTLSSEFGGEGTSKTDRPDSKPPGLSSAPFPGAPYRRTDYFFIKCLARTPPQFTLYPDPGVIGPLNAPNLANPLMVNK
ncbi:hypothetical protein NL676_025030 [Syzygium grande]|nr:hypothetical protein NL676_025030 [Syzygium grande]